MTREEAIEVIKAYYDKLTNSVSNQLDGDIKAFEMAIEALNFDIDQYCKEYFCVMVDHDVWEKAEKILKQEPKTGHWEWVQYDGNPNIGYWHCSECFRIVSGAITARSPVYSYKFCPNCGAKMIESQESELENPFNDSRFGG